MTIAAKKISLSLPSVSKPDTFEPTRVTISLVKDEDDNDQVDLLIRGKCTKAGKPAGDRDFPVRVTPGSASGQKALALVNALLTAAAADNNLKGTVAAQ